ncbi:uncharacterized AAA domain-containing protein C24B10.10c-like [Gastrolobium bilobum]|uniref:uncharacterized AAA domain-containing protein C24B10.10c-like n=1 Tax=Gastrolobium bilobum TaxID=150636 RepID=UPI002AAF4627|nr:uncharacterized AAA domain-containing protein C24B10.10c-like [Gastrolobium bilobum]
MDANKIGVTFADIGGLDDIKKMLKEVVLNHCDGVLFYGPTGTGKTMLAKAIANEIGASLIHVSKSIITSRWYNKQEVMNVRAMFTVEAKVAPSIIFVDEVDSILGQNLLIKAGQIIPNDEAMMKIINEFILQWDELMTKPGNQILILTATNRPFYLDEAIIRWFERR